MEKINWSNETKFNSEGRKNNSVRDFMNAHIQVLELAEQYGFISNEHRRTIKRCISKAINKIADDDKLIVANYEYIIAMRLSAFNNYECMKFLEGITCFNDAYFWVTEIEKWFFARIRNDIMKASECYEKAFEIKNMYIINSLYNCIESLKMLESGIVYGSNINLRKYHALPCKMQYQTLREPEGISYIDRIEDYIKNLRIEMKIITKIASNKSYQNKILFRKRFIYNDLAPEVVIAQQRFDKANLDFQIIIKDFEKKFAMLDRSDEIHDHEYNAFVMKNPDKSRLELEKEFQEFWKNHPDNCLMERWKIDKEYFIQKQKYQSKVTIYQRDLDKAKENQRFFEVNNGNIRSDYNVTLIDILKEYVVFLFYSTRRIKSLEAISKKKEIEKKFSDDEVLKVFLEEGARRFNLIDEEISYLNLVD